MHSDSKGLDSSYMRAQEMRRDVSAWALPVIDLLIQCDM